MEQDIKLHKIGKEPNIFVDLIQSRRNQILEETYGKKIIKAVTAKDGTVKQKTSYIGKLDYVKNTFPWLRSSSLWMHKYNIINQKNAYYRIGVFLINYGRSTVIE